MARETKRQRRDAASERNRLWRAEIDRLAREREAERAQRTRERLAGEERERVRRGESVFARAWRWFSAPWRQS